MHNLFGAGPAQASGFNLLIVPESLNVLLAGLGAMAMFASNRRR